MRCERLGAVNSQISFPCEWRSSFSVLCKPVTKVSKSQLRIPFPSPTVGVMNEGTTKEGFVPFGDYETWYRITGDAHSGVAPLVIAHGGPGCSHDYLDSPTARARSGRAVIHHDQLGGGRSTHLPDHGEDFWTVDLFLS